MGAPKIPELQIRCQRERGACHSWRNLTKGHGQLHTGRCLQRPNGVRNSAFPKGSKESTIVSCTVVLTTGVLHAIVLPYCISTNLYYTRADPRSRPSSSVTFELKVHVSARERFIWCTRRLGLPLIDDDHLKTENPNSVHMSQIGESCDGRSRAVPLVATLHGGRYCLYVCMCVCMHHTS